VLRYRASDHFTNGFVISSLATDAHSFREVVKVDTRVAAQDRSKLESFMMQWSGETVVRSPLILRRKWTRTSMHKVRPMLFYKAVLISGRCRWPPLKCHVSRLIEISLSTSRHLSPVSPYLFPRFKQDKCKTNASSTKRIIPFRRILFTVVSRCRDRKISSFLFCTRCCPQRLHRYLILISMTDLMRKFLERIGKRFKSLSQFKLEAESSIEQKMIFHVTSK